MYILNHCHTEGRLGACASVCVCVCVCVCAVCVCVCVCALCAGQGYEEVQVTLVDCPGHASLIRTIIGGKRNILVHKFVCDARILFIMILFVSALC